MSEFCESLRAGSVWILKSAESFHLIHLTREIGICLLQTPTYELGGMRGLQFPTHELDNSAWVHVGQFLQIPAHRTDPFCRFQEIWQRDLTNSYICVEQLLQIPTGDGFLKISNLGKDSPYILYSYTGDGQFLEIPIHGSDGSYSSCTGCRYFLHFLFLGRTVPRDVCWERQVPIDPINGMGSSYIFSNT